MDCIFCRIASGTIPAEVVLDSPLSLAFRDLSPVAPTHVLVIPKRHIAHAGEIQPGDGDILADMLICARRVAEFDGLAESGYRLVFNVGDDAGNSVPHLHLHVIGGTPMGWPPFAQQ